MAIYAIGDVQGCFDELQQLLEHIAFNPTIDQLWFAGDLVNRGPKSLETLRFIKNLENSAIVVLGNHDLHLLVEACTTHSSFKEASLSSVLNAPDRIELIDWLRHRPLLHYNGEFCLVHAGLAPQWNLHTAQQLASEAEQALRGTHYLDVLHTIYGNQPDIWSNDLIGIDRIRFIINCLTRMRYCTIQGQLDFMHCGAIGTQPSHLMPWFKVPHRQNANIPIIFGHWSTLGYYEGDNCYAIDTGCLWGGQLTAIKLENPMQKFSVNSLLPKPRFNNKLVAI